MTIVTGKVVNGRIEVEDLELPEGTEVEVFIPREGEAYDLTPEEEAEIEAGCAEIERGEYVDGDEFLSQLRSRHEQK